MQNKTIINLLKEKMLDIRNVSETVICNATPVQTTLYQIPQPLIMDVNISKAADLFFPNPSLELVYFEAIANAIDAGSTEVEIKIKASSLTSTESLQIEITDNGEGFTDERFAKFCKLLEVEDKGHKGVGRLVFLRYFNSISIESHYQNKKRDFLFNSAFEGVSNIVDSTEPTQGTKVTFKAYNKDRIKTYSYLRPVAIKRSIMLHFFPLLYQKKLNGEELKIKISLETTSPNLDHNFSSDYQEIKLDELPTLDKVSFRDDSISILDEFHLHYSIKKKEQLGNNCMSIIAVCVDNRTVEMKMPGGDSLPEGYELIFLLISDYLTGRVDSSRQELNLPDAKLKYLKKVFGTKVSELLKADIPEISQKNDELKSQLEVTYPHLHGYFEDESIGLADRDITLEAAQMRFFNDQKAVLEAGELNDEQYEKSLEVSSRLLMEYILYRDLSLKRLKEAANSGLEKEIHDIIIPRKTVDKGESSRGIESFFKNNIWIFDDKFMTYSSVLSDRRMDELLQELAGEEDVDEDATRPDIAIIFSDNPEEVDKVDIVVIELKKQGVKLSNQREVIDQLKQRAQILNDKFSEKVQRVWYYGVAEIDIEFERSLLENEYMQLYSKGKLFYGEEKVIPNMAHPEIKIPINLFILNYDALISDAEARNSTFMDILKKGLSESVN